MLRLLQSSQPVAWGIVPLTFAVLFVLGGVGQLGGWTMAEAPWWGGIAVLATARWIHVVHLESGMRTRPDAVPSWAWVLVATPCLWWTPEMWWWGSLLVNVAMGQALRLRMGENQPGLHFWSGMAMGAIPLVSPDMWGWSAVLPLVLCAWRTPKPGEALALILGGLTPWWFWLGYHGWRTGDVFGGEWPAVETGEVGMGWVFGLAPFGLVGWGLRQQSLGRATARQRVTRKWTQWPGLAAMGAGALAWSLNPSEMAGMGWFMTGFCVAVTWSLGWCLPPKNRVTPYVPWAAWLLSAIGALMPMFTGV